MKNLNLRVAFFSIMGAAVFAGTLFGQVADRAIITGLVTDSSGASIPDAVVTAIQQSTNVKTVVGTSGAGNYTTPPLILGSYTLQIEKAGFKVYVHHDIILTGGMQYRQDAVLEIGALTQTVEVKSGSEMINVQNAEVRHTIDQKYYEDLPMVMGADIRLAESRLVLQPGFQPTAANGDAIFRGSQFRSRIDGGQQQATENWFDGASFGYAEGHSQTQESSLPYGAVKEMTVVANNFSAQYGHTSGGIIQYTTRSGSDQLHGNVYDYLNTSQMNSRVFFIPNVISLTNNNSGFAVGGPVVIPHVYNGKGKTFFFTTYDRLDFRSTVNTGYVNTLPLPAELQGDFSAILKTNNKVGTDALGRPIYSGELYNPATLRQVNGKNVRDAYGFDTVTGAPCAGVSATCSGLPNVIPANDPLRSSIASKVVPFIPQDFARNTIFIPNEFGGTSDDNNKIRIYTWLVRVDHSFSDRFKMSNTFYMNDRPRVAHCGGPGNCTVGVTADPATQSAENTYFGQGFWQHIYNRFEHMQFDYIIKPNLFNHTTLAYDRWFMGGHSLSSGHNWTQVLGLTGLAPTGQTPPVNVAPPILSFGGGPVGGYTALGRAWVDGYEVNNRYQLLDDITWITGKHTIKAGFEARFQQYPQHGWAQNVAPSYNFSNNETAGINSAGAILGSTGDPFASFLLGQVDNSNYNNTSFYTPTQNYFAPWINDDIKVTPKLTINIGVRFDYEGALKEMHGRFSSFSPTAPNPGVGFNNIPGALVFKRSFENPDWNVGPRFGFAYRLSERNVVRGGYGIYYGGVPGTLGGGYPVLGVVSNPSVPQITGGLNPAFYWDGPGATTCQAAQGVGISVVGNGCGFPQEAADFAAIPALRGDLQNPPFIPGGQGIRADASYTTTMPRYQSWNFMFDHQFSDNMSIDIAYVGNHATRLPNASQYLGLAANENDPKILALGTTVLTGRSDAAFAAAGITNPFPGLFTTPSGQPFNITVAQALRPFPQYQAITYRNAASGTSHYNSLQIVFDRRITNGFQFKAAYTWSKLIGNGAESADTGISPSAINAQSGIQNPVDYQRGERGLSNDDVPQFLAIAWIYELPFGQSKKFGSGARGAVDKLIGGWKLSAQQSYNSGRPLSITMNNNLSGLLFNGAKRPDRKVGSPGVNPNFSDPNSPDPNKSRYLLSSGFQDCATRTGTQLCFGTEGRTDSGVRGFGYFNEDMNLYKDTKINERWGVRFEASAGNLFNRVDFCPPNQNWSSGGFGTTTSQCNIPRHIQFGLTVQF